MSERLLQHGGLARMHSQRFHLLVMTSVILLPMFFAGTLPGQAPFQAASKVEELLARAGLVTARRAPPSQDRALRGTGRGTIEARIRLGGADAKAPAAALLMQENHPSQVTLLDRKSFSEDQPKMRGDELTADRLVAASIDAQGNLLDWVIVPDPRIIRSEHPGPDGVLAGAIFYRTDVDFLVSFPDNPALTRIVLYIPRWTGEDWTLDLLGSTGLR